MAKKLNSEDAAKSKVYEVKIQTAAGRSSSLEFNICANVGRRCPDQVADFANLQTAGVAGHCIHMSKPNDMPISYHGRNTMSLKDKDRPSEGVILEYESNAICQANIKYGLKIEVNCNKDVFRTKYELNVKRTNQNPCVPVIEMESPHGCPVINSGALNKWNSKFWMINGSILMVLGIFLMGVGARSPLITMFVITTVVVGTALIVGVFTFVLPSFVP